MKRFIAPSCWYRHANSLQSPSFLRSPTARLLVRLEMVSHSSIFPSGALNGLRSGHNRAATKIIETQWEYFWNFTPINNSLQYLRVDDWIDATELWGSSQDHGVYVPFGGWFGWDMLCWYWIGGVCFFSSACFIRTSCGCMKANGLTYAYIPPVI